MNIGIFTDTYKPNINGVVTSISIKKRELESLGNKVYIIAPCEPEYVEEEENVMRLKSFTFTYQPEYRLAYPPSSKVLKEIDKLKLNIIHAETPFSSGLLAVYVAKRLKIPLVHTYHTLFPEYVHYLKMPEKWSKKMAEKISAIYCNMCDHIIAPSTDVEKELIRYGVKKGISVIPTGIDTSSFKEKKTNHIRKRYDIDENTNIMLYVGRLGKEKNIDFLLDVFANLKEKAKMPLKFILVGDGPYKEELQKKAEDLGIREYLIFAGYVSRDEIVSYYREANAFIFASKTETQGLVILEAMAANIPVVAVKASGVEDMIKNNYSGILTKENVKEFTDKLLYVLTNDKFREKIVDNASEVSEEFSPARTFRKMFVLYEDLKATKFTHKLRRALKFKKNRFFRVIRRIILKRRKNDRTRKIF